MRYLAVKYGSKHVANHVMLTTTCGVSLSRIILKQVSTEGETLFFRPDTIAGNVRMCVHGHRLYPAYC